MTVMCVLLNVLDINMLRKCEVRGCEGARVTAMLVRETGRYGCGE